MATINGDSTNNGLTGTNDDDTITGNAGGDTINGQGGDDLIFGDDGDQSLPDGSLVYSDTFDAGAPDWTVFTTTDTVAPLNTNDLEPSFGSILGQFTGTAASGDIEVATTIGLDATFSDAVVEFDFHRLDSWDNEDFEIFSDGDMIFSQTFAPSTAVGQTQTTTIDGVTYTVSLTSLGDAAERGFWESGQNFTFDQSFRAHAAKYV